MFWGYGKPRFVISDEGSGRYVATLAGHLATEWATNLCSALAERRVDVRGGHAVRDTDGNWMVRFEVSAAGDADPLALDWIELTERRAHYRDASVRLQHFEFAEVAEHGGSIRLDLVEQTDSLGLLAVLFGWLGSLGLVPVEFRLETVDGVVHDAFWLKALAETRPRDEVCVALGRRLAELVAA